jgi:cAMP-dependent protein kinase regulator
MFSALDDNEKEVVINAMTEVKAATNDVIIRQGD